VPCSASCEGQGFGVLAVERIDNIICLLCNRLLDAVNDPFSATSATAPAAAGTSRPTSATATRYSAELPGLLLHIHASQTVLFAQLILTPRLRHALHGHRHQSLLMPSSWRSPTRPQRIPVGSSSSRLPSGDPAGAAPMIQPGPGTTPSCSDGDDGLRAGKGCGVLPQHLLL
jgi:hypothetical protein